VLPPVADPASKSEPNFDLLPNRVYRQFGETAEQSAGNIKQ
jgi:hypothetical protein